MYIHEAVEKAVKENEKSSDHPHGDRNPTYIPRLLRRILMMRV